MNTIIFPLSILLWTMGFSTFAQADCLPLRVDKGVFLEIEKNSNEWIRIATESNQKPAIINSTENLSRLKKFDSTGFFHKVKFHAVSVSLPDCSLNSVAETEFDCLRGRIWLFDFDALQLCPIESDTIEFLERTGYDKIKSRVTSDGISIEIEIRRQRHWVKFDFGFDSLLMLKFDENLPFFKEEHSVVQSLDGTFSVYPNKAIKFNETYYSASVLLGRESKVGIGFLKGFNWIIDMRNRTVYIKKNGVSIDSSNEYQNRTVVKNGVLIVSASDQSKSKFHVGDTISKIDSQTVTAENACEWAARLNGVSTWKSFNIEHLNFRP